MSTIPNARESTTRVGKPVAKLVPFHATTKRKLGAWKGKVRMPRDFVARLPAELLAAFEGRS